MVAVRMERRLCSVCWIAKPARSVPRSSILVESIIFTPEIRKYVPGAELNTDALKSYEGLDECTHKVIDHAEAHVEARLTNGLENFCSLLNRDIRGTSVNVEPFHLFCYLDEQWFRYNKSAATLTGAAFETF